MSTDPKPGAADILFQLAASKQERIEALSEKNRELRARAERAEAELARVRPVVDAAEAMVGEFDGSVVGMSSWEPIHRLVEKVREGQRDG